MMDRRDWTIDFAAGFDAAQAETRDAIARIRAEMQAIAARLDALEREHRPGSGWDVRG
jgi:RNA processing factor Prp31